MTTPRDYGKEYARYHGKPQMIKERAQRNAARAKMEKTHGDLTGKDVDHKRAIRNGGSNKPGNLRVSSVHRNRGWEAE